MKKLVLVIVVLALLAMSIPVLAADKVGVAMPTNSLQRWNQDGLNVKAALEAKGYEVDLQYANNDVATQISQVENMIMGGAKVIVLASIDGGAMGEVMKTAKENGVQTIAYDRLLMDTPDATYYVTFGNEDVGRIQGEFLRDALDLDNRTEPAYGEMFAGSPDDNNAGLFYKGELGVLQPYIDSGKLVITSGQTDFTTVAILGWGSDSAAKRMDTLLAGYYTDGKTTLEFVLSPNDSLAQGVVASLENAGYTKENWPVITGQDCDIASTTYIIEGKQAMSIYKDTRVLAAKAVEMVDAILTGTAVETNYVYNNGVMDVPSYNCEISFADVSNWRELLLDSGYYTGADAAKLEAAAAAAK